MPQQQPSPYLSTDPHAGQAASEYLSTDPNAGEAPQGYWEDRGIAGQMWHPPGVAPGRDPASRRGDTAVIGGLPFIGDVSPEMVVGGVGAGRAILGAIQGGEGLIPRTLAGLQATVRAASPLVKYESARAALKAVGVPEPLASLAAGAFAGYQRGARGGAAPGPGPTPTPTPTPPGSVPRAPTLPPLTPPRSTAPPPMSARPEAPPVPARGAPPAPPVMSPAAETPSAALRPTPSAAPAPVAEPIPLSALAAPPSTPTPRLSPQGWSPQRVRNETGLAARRAKLTLTDEQLEAADALVHQGASPQSAVRTVAPPPPAPKLKVSAAEMDAYTKLRKAGRTHQQATELLQAQRELATRLGLPSPEEVRRTLAERDALGRWRE